MPNTNLKGPYDLTYEEINRVVTLTSAGTYVLGYVNSDGRFVVQYVGRSDDDINRRLHEWIDKGYTSFKFDYFDTAKEAFGKECIIYHDFGGPEGELNNERHPERPDDTDWRCPRCDIFGSSY
jgi:hypothetical protein